MSEDSTSENTTNYAHNRENRLTHSIHIWELEPDETPDRGNRKTMRSVCQAGCTYQALKPGLPDLDADSTCGNCARIVKSREGDGA